MHQDDFWGSYRENTLLVNGIVSSISGIRIELKTTESYKVTCVLSNSDEALKVGNSVRFATEAFTAERQPDGVLLRDCVVF